MDKKVNFDSESLLNIKFEKDVKGYNPLQVDETLDMVISDYKNLESQLIVNQQIIEKLSQEVNSLKVALQQKDIEIAANKKKFDALPKSGAVSQDNVSLLKRIDILERALYQKGVDPKKI